MADWEDRGDGWSRKRIGHGAQCLMTQNNPSSWHWQAVRGDERLSGSAASSYEAKQAAEEVMSLPIEVFNHRVAEKLTLEIEQLAARVIAICPTATVLPGYQAGYEACRARFLTALEELP